MKALKKWYENEKIFPCECLCKFKPNDEKYVVATIVKFYPNNGWYEFVSDNKNTYSIAIPISELEALKQRRCDKCKAFKLDDEFNDGYGKCSYDIHFANSNSASYHKGTDFCCSEFEPKEQ